MQEEFEDPQAQDQALQWPKEKEQSLIYKTLCAQKTIISPTARFFSQETKIKVLFFGHKNNL